MTTKQQTYVSSGNYTWTVPEGIGKVTLECWGAEGGSSGKTSGGLGGYVRGELQVTPGDTLYVTVGEAGETLNGGWPNGGDTYEATESHVDDSNGGGGGGSSDVRYGGSTISDIILLGGGGGGGGEANHDGDSPTTINRSGSGASGGLPANDAIDISHDDTSVDGGHGGESGNFDGENGESDNEHGESSSGASHWGKTASSGAGGGGLDGGTAGETYVSVESLSAGGGGGDSYIDTSLLSNTTHTTGDNSGDGKVTITWTVPDAPVKVWNGEFWEWKELKTNTDGSWTQHTIVYYDGIGWMALPRDSPTIQ